jgi:hypothetical protein
MPRLSSNPLPQLPECRSVRSQFSLYLDGQLSGIAMAAIATHLDGCAACESEFAAWREMQQSLAALGPATAPPGMQARLRLALEAERERGAHLPPAQRWAVAWRRSVAPFALQAAGGFALALVIAGGLSWIFAAPLSVEANDDDQAHLVAPHYLYSQVPPLPVTTSDAPLLVEAKVDADGRVYDYSILAGMASPAVRLRLEQDLLSSVFEPATVFGEPVRGHVMLTYTGVSVHG